MERKEKHVRIVSTTKVVCIIMGDYVKRSGHCSEYEEQKKN